MKIPVSEEIIGFKKVSIFSLNIGRFSLSLSIFLLHTHMKEQISYYFVLKNLEPHRLLLYLCLFFYIMLLGGTQGCFSPQQILEDKNSTPLVEKFHKSKTPKYGTHRIPPMLRYG